MRAIKLYTSRLCLLPLLATLAAAQTDLRVEPAQGNMLWLTRPYRSKTVAPIRTGNSSRLDALTRAGQLYLTAPDVVALAIENNVDVEVQRYAPLLAQEVLRRAKAGGALRSVGLPIAAGPQSVSLQGVSLAADSGLSGGGGGVGSGGGIVTQLGPGIMSLDPTLTAFVNFQHAKTPQSNTILTGTTALVSDSRVFQTQYSQNWDFGLNAQVGYSNQHIKVNSQFFNLNPYTTGALDLQVAQNLLQGFGSAVNGRNIRVQKNNLKVTDLQFKQQLIATISSALNLYWDLVSFDVDVRARRQGLATARQLLDDNRKLVAAGSLAEIEITRAEAQVYAAQQDLVIAETNFMQQETILKNVLSRNGVATAGLSAVRIVPLDKIAVPEKDDIPPLEDLTAAALDRRSEIQQARINLESNKINLTGIKSALKPSLQAFAQFTTNGLAGDLTALGALQPGIAELSGGYGRLLSQIFSANYPSYSAGFSLNIPLRNRAAQSDYATSMLEMRQNELNLLKNTSQVRVDVQNAVIGLRQARARYEAALKSRQLQEETLSADQRKYTLGVTTAFQVVQSQRDLATAQSAEVQAMANYTHARIAYDQALGRTLDVNNVSLDEALQGRVSRQSTLGGVQ
ncbi:MAG: TolC family protein [Candidatus Solibacter usitatus]|nr:TolC family protein [Candidatus Solibacter usitatus]